MKADELNELLENLKMADMRDSTIRFSLAICPYGKNETVMLRIKTASNDLRVCVDFAALKNKIADHNGIGPTAVADVSHNQFFVQFYTGSFAYGEDPAQPCLDFKLYNRSLMSSALINRSKWELACESLEKLYAHYLSDKDLGSLAVA